MSDEQLRGPEGDRMFPESTERRLHRSREGPGAWDMVDSDEADPRSSATPLGKGKGSSDEADFPFRSWTNPRLQQSGHNAVGDRVARRDSSPRVIHDQGRVRILRSRPDFGDDDRDADRVRYIHDHRVPNSAAVMHPAVQPSAAVLGARLQAALVSGPRGPLPTVEELRAAFPRTPAQEAGMRTLDPSGMEEAAARLQQTPGVASY